MTVKFYAHSPEGAIEFTIFLTTVVFICFEQSMQSHPEGTSLATVVLNITNPLSFDFAVRVNTVDGTATGEYLSICDQIY